MNLSITARLGAGRRVANPAGMCERYGIGIGSPLSSSRRRMESDIYLSTDQVSAQAQARVARYIPAGVSWPMS